MQAKLQPADIIATVSLAVAVLALIFTAWQAWITRRHSRLSVKPLLSWGTHKTLTAATFEIVSILTNKGLGPAIVVDRYFTLDGKRYTPKDSSQTLIESLVTDLLPSDLKVHVARQALPGIRSPLLPGDHMEIAHLIFPPFAYDYSEEIEKRMACVQFIVVYEDIYGQRSTFTTEQSPSEA